MSFSFTETKQAQQESLCSRRGSSWRAICSQDRGASLPLRAGGFANPLSCHVITSMTFNNIYFSFQAICFHHKVLLYVLVEPQCLDISGVLLESALMEGLFKNCLGARVGGSLLKPIRTLIYFPSCCQCQGLLRRAVSCFHAWILQTLYHGIYQPDL